MLKSKIRKGDKVIVTTGKDKGKIGEVLSVSLSNYKAVISGVNLVKKHTKPSRDSEGGIITKEMPVDVSNISILDPVHEKPTKIGYKFLDTGEKKRFAKMSGEVIDKVGKK